MKQVATKTVQNQKHCLYLHPSWKKHYKRGNRKRFPLLRLITSGTSSFFDWSNVLFVLAESYGKNTSKK
jgi:hypothetical protein